tara:strand:+ start:24 stop:722 length:699 start_codon:yes stop_codon:yes gene_type:complete
MSASISSLIKHPLVFRGRDHRHSADGNELRLPFGQTNLDKACAGGVPASGVLSIRALAGQGELQLLNNVLLQKAGTQKRIIWLPNRLQLNPNWMCQTPYQQQSWVVNTPNEADALWACEQAIRSQACCCIVIYLAQVEPKAARRLRVLARQYDCLVVLVHPGNRSPGALPVNIDMALSFDMRQWFVDLHRVTGAWPQQHIAIEHPLPASNDAIVNAFRQFSSNDVTAIHEVS